MTRIKGAEKVYSIGEQSGIATITSGIKLIDNVLKATPKPASGEAKKQLQDGVKLLKKKLALMKKDEQLKIQYLDRTCYDTIQGVFQALHLYVISEGGLAWVDNVTDWLRENENCYVIADRMQRAALARADFSGGKK